MALPPNDSNDSSSSSGKNEILTEFHDGSIFIGDVGIPLASPKVRIALSSVGRRTLHLQVPLGELNRLNEAWQRYLHSNPSLATQYPVSELTIDDRAHPPSHASSSGNSVDISYFDVSYIDIKYHDLTYVDIKPRQAFVSNIQYFDVMYTDVVYTDVTYAMTDRREIARPSTEEAVTDPVTLTISGNSEQGTRRVMTIEGIEILHVREATDEDGVVEVVAQLNSTLPIDHIAWLIEGK